MYFKQKQDTYRLLENRVKIFTLQSFVQKKFFIDVYIKLTTTYQTRLMWIYSLDPKTSVYLLMILNQTPNIEEFLKRGHSEIHL